MHHERTRRRAANGMRPGCQGVVRCYLYVTAQASARRFLAALDPHRGDHAAAPASSRGPRRTRRHQRVKTVAAHPNFSMILRAGWIGYHGVWRGRSILLIKYGLEFPNVSYLPHCKRIRRFMLTQCLKGNARQVTACSFQP
jgi:hypothetical protein